MGQTPTFHRFRCASRGLLTAGLVVISLAFTAGCDGTNGMTIPEWCQDLADRVNAAGAQCSPAYTIDPSACHFDSLETYHCIEDECLATDICDESCTFNCFTK